MVHLLNLTIQPPSGIQNAMYGNFSSGKAQEIVTSSGTTLCTYSPDETTGRLVSLHQPINVGGQIRSMERFRLPGTSVDYLILGTDSGKINIMERVNDKWNKVHSETFGKTGCRRITPGQFLAVDPKGRAVLIGAIEKQKLVYVLNRDASSRLTIASPLEAHRSHTIHFDIVGLDVGFENPIFAALEVEYDAPSVKKVVGYELDLGLNHVVRRWQKNVPRGSHKLISVPGGTEGPGGVIVCVAGVNEDDFSRLVYYEEEGSEPITCVLPVRERSDKNNVLIISSATHKQRDLFFTLVQTEDGDVFKVTLNVSSESGSVDDMTISLFDTLPVSSDICITRTGFLFNAASSGNHTLLQFQGLGDDVSIMSKASAYNNESSPPSFTPGKLQNLALIDELPSLAPLVGMNVVNSKLYALCGKAEQSSVRVLTHGTHVSELAVSELPGTPVGVWTLSSNTTNDDSHLIVAFANATLVLAIGETVEEVEDCNILTSCTTLGIQTMFDGSIIQVHPRGIRHLSSNSISSSSSFREWKTPGLKTIDKCTMNARQVIVCMGGGEVLVFEIEANLLTEKASLDIGQDISAVAISSKILKDRLRVPFFAIAAWDNTVRIVSTEGESRQKSTLTVLDHIESLCISSSNFLYIGCSNGVLQSVKMDSVTGASTAVDSRFIGPGGVSSIVEIKNDGDNGVVVMACVANSSARVIYKNTIITPLAYDARFRDATAFTSEIADSENSFVAVAGNTLRILSVDKWDDKFNTTSIPSFVTPRRMVSYNNDSGIQIVISTDNNNCNSDDDDTNKMEEEEKSLRIKSSTNSSNNWGSNITLIDTKNNNDVISKTTLPVGDAAVSIATCMFHDRGNEVFILVGIVTGLSLHNDSNNIPPKSRVAVYRMAGHTLLELHSTSVPGIPYGITAFNGRVVVSCGNAIRLYDLGRKQLLCKAEKRNFPSMIVNVKACGPSRLYVADVSESVFYVLYDVKDNSFSIVADDTTPRFVSAMTVVDYDTVAGGDKFGNLFVLRLPDDAIIENVVASNESSVNLWEKLDEAPNKLSNICQFHIGEAITSIHLSSLMMHDDDKVLIYSGIMGTIGALVPLRSKEDVDFYTHLEMYMRQESDLSLSGSDLLKFRSYFIPMKNTTDGDLCTSFNALSNEKQLNIANGLDKSVSEINKKLQDMQNRLF